MTIPMKYKEVVYYLGLDPKEIVSVKKISSVPQTWDVHLRWGDKEWRGHIEAPPWSLRPPVTRLDDLLNNTKDCEACHGTGKVSK